MKRTLIKENQNLLNEILKDLRGYRPALTNLNDAYDELQMGPLSKEAFRDIVENGLSNIYPKYTANLEAELDKTGVKNPILRKTVLAASEPVFDKFRKAFEDLVNYAPRPSEFNPRPMLALESISYNGEFFEVAAEDQEIILENHCRVYLENEAENAFHNTLSNLQDALNAYLKEFERYELAGKTNGFCGLETFLKLDGSNVTIKPESINYGVSVSDRAKKRIAQKLSDDKQRTEAAAEALRKFHEGDLPGQIIWNQLNQTENLVN